MQTEQTQPQEEDVYLNYPYERFEDTALFDEDNFNLFSF